MIGAILIAHPEKVADCIKAMQDATDIEVTIKHRIGIDEMEDYSGMANFVESVANTGCKTFIVHARKAWLKGLSPKEEETAAASLADGSPHGSESMVVNGFCS